MWYATRAWKRRGRAGCPRARSTVPRRTPQNRRVARQQTRSQTPQPTRGSRVPAAVGALPVVGDLMRQADSQAQWLQDVVEQNARLVGQFPATMRTFNDTLERFNQTVARLDRTVSTIESLTDRVVRPLELVVPVLERQVGLLTSTVDRVVGIVGELPGAGLLRRVATGQTARAEDAQR